MCQDALLLQTRGEFDMFFVDHFTRCEYQTEIMDSGNAKVMKPQMQNVYRTYRIRARMRMMILEA